MLYSISSFGTVVRALLVAHRHLVQLEMVAIFYGTATNAVAQVGTRRNPHGRVLALQTVILGYAGLRRFLRA